MRFPRGALVTISENHLELPNFTVPKGLTISGAGTLLGLQGNLVLNFNGASRLGIFRYYGLRLASGNLVFFDSVEE